MKFVGLTSVKREEIRLETQHDVLLKVCENKLFFPRIDNPRKILDCGYGRGDWAVAVAEEYEDCEVRFSPFAIPPSKGCSSQQLIVCELMVLAPKGIKYWTDS
jgi:hypothetical protein